MDSGHRWEDIRKYTLGEVGVFLRTSATAKAAKEHQDFIYRWLGAHLNEEGFGTTVKNLEKRYPDSGDRKQAVNHDLVEQNWQSMDKTFRGLK